MTREDEVGETTALSAGRPDARVGGRYRLEGLVGRGGSAEVWRAEDEALGRSVAVKLVTASGGEDAGRVGAEARLLARLSHPGLVPVYDAGTDEAGRPWVVMELVVGETLADAIARGPMPSQRVAEIGRVLAEALAYVHAQGLVHRDVKPANVLLGDEGRVRLTDFGIARLVDAAHVTATGLTVGTASYLSPEQVIGSHVGPLSDIYSLGLVLLECLKGEREYPGSAVEVALARLNRPPRIPASLPAGWPGLLEAMTSRESGPRPTASGAAAELGRIAVGDVATTVLPVAAPTAERTQLIDSTQLIDTPLADRTQVLERTRVVKRPDPQRESPAALPAPRGRRRPRVGLLLLLAAVLALVAGALLLQQGSSDSRGPTAPAVSKDLPSRLRSDLQDLQKAVQP